MDQTTVPRAELIRIIFELQDKVKLLEAQIAEFRSRLKDQGSKEKEPLPSWVKPNVKRKKKGARKLDSPTKQVFHSFAVCPDCGGVLGKPSVSYARQTIEIAPTPVEVMEHGVFKT